MPEYIIHRWQADATLRVYECVPPQIPTVFTRESDNCQGCGLRITFRLAERTRLPLNEIAMRWEVRRE